MKKLFITASIAAMFTLGAFAKDGGKKDDSKNVSYFVLNQFSSDFSSAKDVVWTVTPSTQKADFIEDDVKMTAFYSLTGEFLGTTQEVAIKVLPKSAVAEISDTYKGYTVGQVIKFDSSDAESSFYRTLAVDQPQATSYFVDLKNADSEVLVRVTEQGSVYFFKQVK